MSHVIQAICILAGAALITASRLLGWGPAALMGGIFFVYIAVMTILIDLAGVPGFWQPFLRSKLFGIFQILSVLGMIIATVVVGILQRTGYFG